MPVLRVSIETHWYFQCSKYIRKQTDKVILTYKFTTVEQFLATVGLIVIVQGSCLHKL